MRTPHPFLSLLLSGCLVGGSGGPAIDDPEPDPDEEDAGPEQPGTFGVVISPRHGDLISGETARSLIAFRGYHERPTYGIALQVLEDPSDLLSWTTIASAVTDEAVAEDVGADELFAWSVVVDPMADGINSRWPQGGLLRLRAVGSEGEVLSRLYADADCGDELAVRALVDSCGDEVDTGLIVVSPVPGLADEPIERPGFLLDKGVGSALETDEYYATINAPATADEFRARFGFDAENDVVGTYFNNGDLATGREVRCRPYSENGVDGVACLTGNYGFFSGDRNLALAQAVEGTESGVSAGAFALVAMIYVPPITDPNSVQFMVYGANGQLVNEAELDTHGDNASIPHNCINCHGSDATYDPETNVVSGARFLPFDISAFAFSSESGYTLVDQSEPLRQLNDIVYQAELSIGSRELVDGWYGENRGVPGTTADTEFVPAGWTASLRSIETYNRVTAPFCRACHSSRELAGARDPLDFTTLEQMSLSAAKIGEVVCGTANVPASHRMPSAQAVAREFWKSSARAYLADIFDVPGTCAP